MALLCRSSRPPPPPELHAGILQGQPAVVRLGVVAPPPPAPEAPPLAPGPRRTCTRARSRAGPGPGWTDGSAGRAARGRVGPRVPGAGSAPLLLLPVVGAGVLASPGRRDLSARRLREVQPQAGVVQSGDGSGLPERLLFRPQPGRETLLLVAPSRGRRSPFGAPLVTARSPGAQAGPRRK